MFRNVITGACVVIVLAGLWLSLKPSQTDSGLHGDTLSYFLSVTEGIVTGPAVLVAREGFPVEVVIVSDQDDLVHLHGYELQQAIQAGQTLTLAFEARLAGRYLLELETSGIPLASLEVYPR